MAFVKLDCGMINSTIWFDREAREVFITALLMAHPIEIKEPTPQIEVRTLNETGFVVRPGWYGFVPAAGTGIVRTTGIDQEAGMLALERLGAPDDESRTPDHDGRRMVRVNGGYIIMNYDKYRLKDYTASERMRRFRERKYAKPVNTLQTPLRVTGRNVTQAEAEAEVDYSLSKDKLAVSDKPKPARTPKLSDEEFIQQLKPKYPRIDVDAESLKMDAWLLAHPTRKKTRGFVVNWLGRVDPGMPVATQPQQQQRHDIRKHKEPATCAN